MYSFSKNQYYNTNTYKLPIKNVMQNQEPFLKYQNNKSKNIEVQKIKYEHNKLALLYFGKNVDTAVRVGILICLTPA